MQLVNIFLDTSAMPRDLARPGHAVQQIIDLVEAKLIKIHASTVAVREWRSQMTGKAREGVNDMHKGLRTMLRQDLLNKLSNFDLLSQINSAQRETEAEVDRLSGEECDKFLRLMGLCEISIGSADPNTVFDGYFAGSPPFCAPKSRQDLPDAFILCAANTLSSSLHSGRVLATCGDNRLRKALGEIDEVRVFENLKALIESEEIQEAMNHLALFKAWTSGKKEKILRLLRAEPAFITEAIDKYVADELPGTEFTDPSIPVDNDVAMIGYAENSKNLDIHWDDLEQFGPGWLVVPFAFDCNADLSLRVFRGDAFSMPDWIEVSLGDFEGEYYFDASAHRAIRVSGLFSFRFTKDDLDRAEPVPSGIELEEVEIELLDPPDVDAD